MSNSSQSLAFCHSRTNYADRTLHILNVQQLTIICFLSSEIKLCRQDTPHFQCSTAHNHFMSSKNKLCRQDTPHLQCPTAHNHLLSVIKEQIMQSFPSPADKLAENKTEKKDQEITNCYNRYTMPCKMATDKWRIW